MGSIDDGLIKKIQDLRTKYPPTEVQAAPIRPVLEPIAELLFTAKKI